MGRNNHSRVSVRRMETPYAQYLTQKYPGDFPRVLFDIHLIHRQFYSTVLKAVSLTPAARAR